jgi:hypothetical protein
MVKSVLKKVPCTCVSHEFRVPTTKSQLLHGKCQVCNLIWDHCFTCARSTNHGLQETQTTPRNCIHAVCCCVGICVTCVCNRRPVPKLGKVQTLVCAIHVIWRHQGRHNFGTDKTWLRLHLVKECCYPGCCMCTSEKACTPDLDQTIMFGFFRNVDRPVQVVQAATHDQKLFVPQVG